MCKTTKRSIYAGYSGPIEVEIFNQAIWDTDGDAVLAQMCQRYLEHV